MSGWSNIWVIGFIAIVCVIATWITYRILKEEEKKQNDYKRSDTLVEDEIERSLQYEKRSLTSNVPKLSWIYIVSIGLSLVVFAIYLVTLI